MSKIKNSNLSSIIDDTAIPEGSSDSDFWKTINTLMDDNFYERKTILNNRQVPKISVLTVLAQIYDVEFLKNFIPNYARWRTSGDSGKGRQDIVDICKAKQQAMSDQSEAMLEALRGR